jgi:hypothetical protein
LTLAPALIASDAVVCRRQPNALTCCFSGGEPSLSAQSPGRLVRIEQFAMVLN